MLIPLSHAVSPLIGELPMMTIKVVDQHEKPVMFADVVVREIMEKWLRRLKESNCVNTDSIRGQTDSKGCVYMNVHYNNRAEIAVNGRIYGVFLLSSNGEIIIRVKD